MKHKHVNKSIYVYTYIYIYIHLCIVPMLTEDPGRFPHIKDWYTYRYIHIWIYMYIYYIHIRIRNIFVVDSASLPFKFLTRLPGVCSGGEGIPPETLKCLAPIPQSWQRLELDPGPSHPSPTPNHYTMAALNIRIHNIYIYIYIYTRIRIPMLTEDPMNPPTCCNMLF